MDRHESIRSFLGRYGLSAEEYYPSSRLSAFRAGGTLEWYVLPDSAESAEALLSFARREELHLKAIGRGSNLIFSDRLHEGIFVGTKMMSDFLILPGRVTT